MQRAGKTLSDMFGESARKKKEPVESIFLIQDDEEELWEVDEEFKFCAWKENGT